MYGYDSVDELLSRPAVDYYDEANPREKMLAELMEKGELLSYITLEKTSSGEEIWVSTNYRLVKDEKGDPAYIDGVIENITEFDLFL